MTNVASVTAHVLRNCDAYLVSTVADCKFSLVRWLLAQQGYIDESSGTYRIYVKPHYT